MGTAASRIRCEIDFDRPGRQAGYLRAPQSRNTSGWGVVEIPIYVLKNGAGPTLLLTGGVHGDEYEGQIAVSRLAQTLRAGGVERPADPDPRGEHSRGAERHALVADRRARPQPLLSRQPGGQLSRRCWRISSTAPSCRMWMSRSTSTPRGIRTNACRAPTCTTSPTPRCAQRRWPRPRVRRAVQRGLLGRGRGRDADLVRRAPQDTVARNRDRRMGSRQRRGRAHRRARRAQRAEASRHAAGQAGDRAARRLARNPAHDGARSRLLLLCPGRRASSSPATWRAIAWRAGQRAGFLHFVEDVDHPALEVHYGANGVLWMAAGPGPGAARRLCGGRHAGLCEEPKR